MPYRSFRPMLSSGLLTALLLGIASTQVSAGPLGGFAGDRERFDLDGDGRVTRAEIKEVREQDFLDADTSGDEVLSAQEVQAYEATRAADRLQASFDKVDADEDDAITLAELTDARPRASEAALEVVFDLLDADLSGSLNLAEWEALLSDDGQALMRYAILDRDGDGSVSESEFNRGWIQGIKSKGKGKKRKGKGKKRKGKGKGKGKGRNRK